jgi:hypothetical protein
MSITLQQSAKVQDLRSGGSLVGECLDAWMRKGDPILMHYATPDLDEIESCLHSILDRPAWSADAILIAFLHAVHITIRVQTTRALHRSRY